MTDSTTGDTRMTDTGDTTMNDASDKRLKELLAEASDDYDLKMDALKAAPDARILALEADKAALVEALKRLERYITCAEIARARDRHHPGADPGRPGAALHVRRVAKHGDTRMTDKDEVDAALDRISSKGDFAWTCRQQARIELTELRAKLAEREAAPTDEMIGAGIEAGEVIKAAMRARERSISPEDLPDYDEGDLVLAVYVAIRAALSTDKGQETRL